MSDAEIAVIRYQVESSLCEAVHDALDRKRRLGQYAVIAVNGQPHRIGPEEIATLLEQLKSARNSADEYPALTALDPSSS